MRIVVAPNAFKGSLSALAAAKAIADGIRIADPDADLTLVPIADGGDGTVDALVAGADGQHRVLRVRGPLTDPVDADYGVIDGGKTAVIEMAKAAGLALVPQDKRDPRVTTTYGVGELLPPPTGFAVPSQLIVIVPCSRTSREDDPTMTW